MMTVEDLLIKIEANGSLSLTPSERTFVVEVFRAAAVSSRPEIQEVKEMIQKAHLEYCWSMTQT